MLILCGARVHPEFSSGQKGAEPALYLAVQGGHQNVVKLLLRRRSSDAHIKDENGLTPLMKAARCGHADIVRLLLGKGVDPQTRETNGRTAIQMAVDGGHDEVVGLLLDLGG